MKKCSYCDEELQYDAIKCKHCGEYLNDANVPCPAEEKLPWYFGKPFIVIAVLCIGPLALPLIWWRPQTSRAWKIGLTVGILVISYVLLKATLESIHMLRELYKMF